MSRPLLEFGGGSGEILRDLLHLRSVSEAEALISGGGPRSVAAYQCHVPSGAGTPWPLPRTPAATQRSIDLAAPPALHVAFDVAGPADEALGGVGRGAGDGRPSVSTVTVSSTFGKAAQGCSWGDGGRGVAATASRS